MSAGQKLQLQQKHAPIKMFLESVLKYLENLLEEVYNEDILLK